MQVARTMTYNGPENIMKPFMESAERVSHGDGRYHRYIALARLSSLGQ